MEGAGGEVEGEAGAEVGEAGEEHPCDGSHDADPEELGEAADGADVAVEEKHCEKARGDGDGGTCAQAEAGCEAAEEREMSGEFAGVEHVAEGWREVAGVLGETDAAGGDGERSAEGELPDEEEGDHAAGASALS